MNTKPITDFIARERKLLLTGVITILTVFGIMHAAPTTVPPPVAPEPGKVATFLPPPTTNGPAYVYKGETVTGGGAFNAFDVGKEPVSQCVVADAGTPVVIYPETPIFAPGETCDYDFLIDFTPPGVTAATIGATGRLKREILGTMVNGVCMTPDGGTFDHLSFSDLGPSISDASANIIQQEGGYIAVQAWAPLTECIGASNSGVRRLPSWQGLDASAIVDGATPAILQVSPLSIAPEAGATTLTIFSTHGDMRGQTSAVVAGQTLGSFAVANSHTATGVLPAGYYDAGTYNVSVSGGPSALLSCPGCLTAGAVAGGGPTPTITSIVPNYAVAGGSPISVIKITGTNLLGGTPAVSFGGVAGAVTSNSGTVATVTAPACTGAPLSCTGTSGISTAVTVTWTTSGGSVNSSGTFPNNFWYLPSSLDAVWSAQTVTLAAGNAHVILDESGNGYNATAFGSDCPWTATGEGSGATPYIATATCTGYANGVFPIQAGGTSEWFGSGTHVGSDPIGYDKFMVEGSGGMLLESQSTTGNFVEYNGAFANAIVVGTIGSTHFAFDALFNGASSSDQCCSGTLVNSGNPGTTVSGATGITIGDTTGGGFPWIGRFMFLAHAPIASVTAPARTTMRAYFNDQGLNPW